MGAELCLAHDMGGWRHWGPLLVDMQPYDCFITIVGSPILRNRVPTAKLGIMTVTFPVME